MIHALPWSLAWLVACGGGVEAPAPGGAEPSTEPPPAAVDLSSPPTSSVEETVVRDLGGGITLEMPDAAPAPLGAPVDVGDGFVSRAPDATAQPLGFEVPGAVFSEIHPEDGPLGDQIRARVAKAEEKGLTPFVQFFGNWCGPCRELRMALEDERMADAFSGTYVIMVDTMRWRTIDPSVASAFPNSAVPSFFEVDADGTFGDQITGDEWGENVPANMAPPLRSFFRRHGVEPAD